MLGIFLSMGKARKIDFAGVVWVVCPKDQDVIGLRWCKSRCSCKRDFAMLFEVVFIVSAHICTRSWLHSIFFAELLNIIGMEIHV